MSEQTVYNVELEAMPILNVLHEEVYEHVPVEGERHLRHCVLTVKLCLCVYIPVFSSGISLPVSAAHYCSRNILFLFFEIFNFLFRLFTDFFLVMFVFM